MKRMKRKPVRSQKPSPSQIHQMEFYRTVKDLGTQELSDLFDMNTTYLVTAGFKLTSLLEQVKKTRVNIARMTREGAVLSVTIDGR